MNRTEKVLNLIILLLSIFTIGYGFKGIHEALTNPNPATWFLLTVYTLIIIGMVLFIISFVKHYILKK